MRTFRYRLEAVAPESVPASAEAEEEAGEQEEEREQEEEEQGEDEDEGKEVEKTSLVAGAGAGAVAAPAALPRKLLREKLLGFMTLFALFKRPQKLPQSDRLKDIYFR